MTVPATGRAGAVGRTRLFRAITIGLLLAVLSGCSWQVVPPEPTASSQTVFVSVYGRHTRLALPARDEPHYIEYGFGDWRYYALVERSWPSGLRALFLSGASTLSRQELAAPQNPDDTPHFGSQRTAVLSVPDSNVTALRDELEATWAAADGRERVRNGHTFREIDRPYGLINNSNRQTARWLEQLDCTVHGLPVLSNFEIKD